MQEVGRYQIDEMSGEGAMARVYKAYDPKIDRTLAIKALKSHLLADDEYRARFLREAKGAGILSHPNIVTVFDVGEEDRQPYIAMEWVDGPTLADLMKGGKTFTPRQIVEIGIQLARALDYAHKKGIVHRDVKPGNIMLVHDTLTVKVADFGICRINETEQTQKADQTQMGAVLGTPNYMSPEQVQGLPVDARSDLFSAGVVLYQMLTGHLPFEGDSMISVVYKIANTDAPTLDALRPDLPLSLRRVIARALKKAPEKRYQSGEAFAQALIGIAREIDEDARRKGKARVIPLGIRWALAMAALVAVTMSLTAMVLYQRQYAAMLDQATGYGGSLTKLVAVQTAVPLLGEDWAAIDVFIQETQSRQEFPYLLVVDHRGIIRGSSDAAQVGTQYKAPQATPMPAHDPAVTVQSYRLRRQARGARLRHARPLSIEGDRQNPPRALRGAAHQGREPDARAADDPDDRHQRGGRGRHVSPCATSRRADPGVAQFAEGARARPLRLPDRRQAQRRVRRALFRLRPDRRRARKAP